ncbi:MAG TPA: metallophosphoesterase [Sumerlaeia bacterium]|nr:metallophosphoesterase [Sumerlaeia bacterium]
MSGAAKTFPVPALRAASLLLSSSLCVFGAGAYFRPELLWLCGIDITPYEGLTLASLGVIHLVGAVLLPRAVFSHTAAYVYGAVLMAAAALIGSLCLSRHMAAHGGPAFVTTDARLESASNAPLRLAFLGDVGHGARGRAAIDRQLQSLQLQTRISAAFLLGDNIHVDADYETAFERCVRTPFEGLFQGETPVYAALGNHDYSGGYIEAERLDPRLGMRGRRYYRWTAGDGLCSVFVIDTETLPRDPRQYRWLKESASADNSTWTILVGHRPAYASDVCTGPDAEVCRILASIFGSQRSCDLLIAGHNHVYERRNTSVPRQYALVVGSCGKAQGCLWPLDSDRLAQNCDDKIFVYLDISRERLSGHAVTSRGVEIDRFEMRKQVGSAISPAPGSPLKTVLLGI